MTLRNVLRAACLCGLLAVPALSQEGDTAEQAPEITPVTAANPDIPLDELALMVKPLTADELKAEASAWMSLLQAKTHETSRAELAIKQKNKSIEKAEDVQDAIEETQEVLEEVEDVSLEAGESGSVADTEEAQALAQEARAAVAKTVRSIEAAVETREQVDDSSAVRDALTAANEAKVEELADQAEMALEATEEASMTADRALAAAEGGRTDDAARLSGLTAQAAATAGAALEDSSEVIDQAISGQADVRALAEQVELDETARMAEELARQELADKKDILLSVTELRTQRTALTDRLNLVLDELSKKLGTTAEGGENEFIVPFRLYAQSVNTIKVDVTDTQSALSNVRGWLSSDLGGLRLLRNLGYLLLSVVSFWLLGWVLGLLVDRALRMTRVTVELMRAVIVRSVRRVTLLIGIVIGLAAMGINVGPILAILGAAGFVVAFALQDTLSNFASGIMIMIYRPFDVGDLISVGGVTGEARSMNLVSTTIATRDNQLLVIPNNTIWNNIIINITGSDTRRVDLIFRIGYQDDIETAQSLMQAVLDEHPLVLEEPNPTIAVEELGAVSVNFICRPWARTENYWQVWREVTRNVKERFEQAGLEPPFLNANVRGVSPWPEAASQPPTFPTS